MLYWFRKIKRIFFEILLSIFHLIILRPFWRTISFLRLEPKYIIELKDNQTIPKIIHHVWVDNNYFPDEYDEYRETWIKHHPDWKHMFWTKDRIESEFDLPHFYDKLPSYASKSDVVRCFILQKFGGVYVDTDYECFKNIEPLLSGSDCVVLLDSVVCPFMMYSNGFLASIPNHEIYNDYCDSLNIRYDEICNGLKRGEYYDELDTFGPKLLTRYIKQYRKNGGEVRQVPRRYLYPLNYHERHLSDKDLKRKLPFSFAYHHFKNSTWAQPIGIKKNKYLCFLDDYDNK